MIRVRYTGESDPLYFIHGKEYTVIGEEMGMYRIVDETGEDYLYDLDEFVVVEEIQNGNNQHKRIVNSLLPRTQEELAEI